MVSPCASFNSPALAADVQQHSENSPKLYPSDAVVQLDAVQ